MGVPVTLSRRLTRAGLVIAAAASAATVAVGCGSQVATTTSATQSAHPSGSPGGIIPGGPMSTGAALCSNQAAVTRLVVRRATALPQNHLHFTFPARVTVSSPARARAVAGMVCGLPGVPHGPMSCPAGWGVSYRLSFAAGSKTFPVVTAGADGCGVVTGAGPARWTARVPGFLTVLAHAMGISGAAALLGTRPVMHGGGPVS